MVDDTNHLLDYHPISIKVQCVITAIVNHPMSPLLTQICGVCNVFGQRYMNEDLKSRPRCVRELLL